MFDVSRCAHASNDVSLASLDACGRVGTRLKIAIDSTSALWDHSVMNYVIYDGHGYWCARRRVDGRVLEMWSARRCDAARFHFLEVAQKVASTLPQRVVVKCIMN
jgi:hypothetical protein